MKRLLFPLLLLLSFAAVAQAQYVKVLGVAEQSNVVTVSGVSSSTKAARTFPSAVVAIYNAGTLTPATIYSASTGTIKANPTTADSFALYDFFILPGSVFDVRIAPSGGSPVPFTRSGYTAPGTGGISLALCGGTADTSLLAALSALGGTIQIPSGTTCASNTQTISAGLQIDNGGLLKPLNGETVTLTGAQLGGTSKRFTNATAGLGTISFNGSSLVREVYPTWWGTNTTPGTTDMGAAIIASVAAAVTNTAQVTFPSGTYAYATAPNFGFNNLTVQAAGRVTLKHTGTGPALAIYDINPPFPGTINNVNVLGDFRVQGNASTSTDGVLIEGLGSRSHIQLNGRGAPGAMFTVKWAVRAIFDLDVSSNQGSFSVMPTTGLVITSNPGGATTSSIFNVTIEGVHGLGIDLDDASNCTIAGTSESNYIGGRDNIIDTQNTFNDLYLNGNVHSATISAASNASPVSLTSATHGLATGDRVTISGGTGNWAALNGRYTITVTGANTFTVAVDTTTFGAVTGTLVFESGADLLLYGIGSLFNNALAASQGPNVDVITAVNTKFNGGYLRSVFLQSGSANTQFEGTRFSDAGTAGITGAATKAVGSAPKTDNHDLITSIYPDYFNGPFTVKKMADPVTATDSALLTITQLMNGTIVGTPTAAAAYQVPTGSNMEPGPYSNDDAFQWSIINVATTAAFVITVTANTDHTLVGVMTVQSAHATTGGLYGNSVTFCSRRVSTTTWKTYRGVCH